jgi:hypothetical protein
MCSSIQILCTVLALCVSVIANAVTINVTNFNDSGAGSLRAAVAAVTSPADVVKFTSVGTVTLLSPITSAFSDVTISGIDGTNRATISGGNSVRCLIHTGTGTLSLKYLNITNCKNTVTAKGSAVWANNLYVLVSSIYGNTLDNNSASVMLGGAVYVTNTALFSSTNVDSNTMTPGHDVTEARGAGVYVGGTLSYTNGWFHVKYNVLDGNNSEAYVYGGGLAANSFSLNGAEFKAVGNTVKGGSYATPGMNAYGGGIQVNNMAVNATGPVLITDNYVYGGEGSGSWSGFDGTAFGGGGMIGTLTKTTSPTFTVSNNTVYGGQAAPYKGNAYGGGLWITSTNNTLISGITISNNTLRCYSECNGGGLYASGKFSGLTVSGNNITAETWCYGAGIYGLNTDFALASSNVSNNSINAPCSAVAMGAGIYVGGGGGTTGYITGNTISGNHNYAASGASAQGIGLNAGNLSSVSNNTITSNTSGSSTEGSGSLVFNISTYSGNSASGNTYSSGSCPNQSRYSSGTRILCN